MSYLYKQLIATRLLVNTYQYYISTLDSTLKLPEILQSSLQPKLFETIILYCLPQQSFSKIFDKISNLKC